MTSDARPIRRGWRSRRTLGSIERRNLRNGLLFISPWLIGFLVLGVFPILYTFYLSLTRYSGIRDPIFVGTQNYERMVDDPLFWKAIYNTLYYTLLAVPIGVVVAMVLALAMNQRIREIAIYRAVFYLPCDPARLRDLVHLHPLAQSRIRAGEPRALRGRAARAQLAG